MLTILAANSFIDRTEMLGSMIKAQCYILEPMHVDITVVRNLASTWYRERPLTYVDIHVPKVSVCFLFTTHCH